jgi:hypothetical protein
MQLLVAQPAETRKPVAVLVTTHRKGAEAFAPHIARRVFESLQRERVTRLLNDPATMKELRSLGFSDPRSCQGARACIRRLAQVLGPRAVVVSVDVGKVGKTLAIHLSAVAADQPESLGSLDVSAPFHAWTKAMAAPMVVFARTVKANLTVLPPPAVPAEPTPVTPPMVADVPVKSELLPRQAVSQALPVGPVPVPLSMRQVSALVFTGTAVASAGTSVALAIKSQQGRSRFEASLVPLADGTFGTSLPEAQARALSNAANTEATVALTCGVVSAGLGIIAAILFAQP